MNTIDLGALVKKERADRRMTQGELAEKLGVTTNTICKFEHGKTPMKLYQIMDALDLFGYELAVIKDGESLRVEAGYRPEV